MCGKYANLLFKGTTWIVPPLIFDATPAIKKYESVTGTQMNHFWTLGLYVYVIYSVLRFHTKI